MVSKKKLDMTLNIQRVRFGDLQKYENNPRVNEGAIEPTKESITQFKYQVPIIVTKDNVIIAGHTRLEALKKLGAKPDDPIDVQVFNGTADQAKAFRLVENKSSEFSGWNFELLDLELQEVELNLDPWFPAIEDDSTEEVAWEDDSDTETSETSSDTSEEKKTIICPHCGKMIEL